MSNAACRRSLGEAALFVLVTSEHMPLAAILQLRATSRSLCEVITGHMPGKLGYELKGITDRNKVGATSFCKPELAKPRPPRCRLDQGACV